MIGYQQTIQSEYANSPTLQQLISCVNSWLDQENNIDAFYDNVWNLETATGYGLDVWGRIVGVTRILQVSPGTYIGWSNSGDVSEVGWSQTGIWYSGQPATGNYALTDAAFLQLIYAKARFNLWDGSIPELNEILMTLFGASGEVWAQDNGNMTLTYVFAFTPSALQQAILGSGVIPRPVGVLTGLLENPVSFSSDGGALLVPPGAGYPTSSAGLSAGALWSNGGIVSVVPGSTPNPSVPPVIYGGISTSQFLVLGGANLPTTGKAVGSGIIWNNGGDVNIS
jgi:hypothetical protein